MALRFYNSLSGQKEEFKAREPGLVRIYSCGPTVYNLNHIGNFRAYVFTDLLRRYLKYKKYKVEHCVNITDVEDKIILNSSKNNQDIKTFTANHIKNYLEDLQYLGMEEVEHRPRATECISEMVTIIERLLEKNHAYEKDGSIYFRISSFHQYGDLAGLDQDELRTAADGRFDADEYTKENVRDFALWKKSSEMDKAVGASWQTPFGEGRPGWHLECSAMIRKIFGENGIDIHTGGIDLLFPHHENEIAQSCCAWPNENFAKYWLHNEHLLVEGKKMSKSAGNFFTLRELTKEDQLIETIAQKRAPEFLLEMVQNNTMPTAMRYLLIGTHYRQKLNFTFDGLKSARSLIDNVSHHLLRYMEILGIEQNCYTLQLDNWDAATKKSSGIVEKRKQEFILAMDDDLNISKAVASLFEMFKDLQTAIYEDKPDLNNELICALQHIREVNQVLNIIDLDFHCYRKKSLTLEFSQQIDDLIEERNLARKNKDFKRSDEIRDELLAKCIIIKDTPEGTIWEQGN